MYWYINTNIKISTINQIALKKNNIFGINLKRLRRSKGLSQTVLANQINELTGAKLRHNVISNYENGVTLPSLSLVPTIANILNTSVDLLLGGADEETVIDESQVFSKDDQLDKLKENYLDLEPFLRVPRIDHQRVDRQQLEAVVVEQYDLIDKLLREVTRLKDDNMETKEKLFNMREKLERYFTR